METVTNQNPKRNTHAGRIATIIGVIFVLAIVGMNSFTQVQFGHVGLYKTFGKLNENVLKPGIHLKIPFIQTVIQVNTQVTKTETDTTASSKDLQPISTHVVVNYSVNEDSAYKLMNNIGSSYDTIVINPAVQEIVKEVTARFQAEELISIRDQVATMINEELTKRLAVYDLNVREVNIVNFSFSDAFNQSIEAKQVAQQQALKASNDLKRIEIEAKQKIAQAQAEAESLKLKKQEVTPELVKLKQIEVQEKAVEKWDGHLPQVTGGATPFIDVQSLGNSSAGKSSAGQ